MKLFALSLIVVSIPFVQGAVQDPTTPPAPTTPLKVVKQVKSMRVIVDDKEVSFGANGVRTFGGRTFVPFRALFEALGSEVDYDLVHKKVTATKGNNEIELTVGEVIARKNGAEITMEAAPQLVKATTYVPLRFVAESLDAEVDYDGAAGVIKITTKG
ncbi:MAG: copper amine oxidase N-terminal domain-containing protein [Armatimonadota bacterium]